MSHPEPAIEVGCQECGLSFQLSRRNARERVHRGITTRCGFCRHGTRPSAEQVAEARPFWIEQLGPDEARRLAGLIRPDS